MYKKRGADVSLKYSDTIFLSFQVKSSKDDIKKHFIKAQCQLNGGYGEIPYDREKSRHIVMLNFMQVENIDAQVDVVKNELTTSILMKSDSRLYGKKASSAGYLVLTAYDKESRYHEVLFKLEKQDDGSLQMSELGRENIPNETLMEKS